MVVFLALFLASLFLLMNARSRTASSVPPSTPQQAYVATSYRCSACGNDVPPTSKFCGHCGVPLKI
jgi:rRNA maturation endonuclease Nob1